MPAHLFTSEFWGDVKEILDEEGIVAVVSGRHVTYSRVLVFRFLNKFFGDACRTTQA